VGSKLFETDTVELSNDCLCCTAVDEFVPTIEALMEPPDPPEYIMIEASTGSKVTVRRSFQLPTNCIPIIAPSVISVRRESSRHMTVLPGGGSVARGR
jgi:hypothetical protein